MSLGALGPKSLMRKKLRVCPFHRWENWGTKVMLWGTQRRLTRGHLASDHAPLISAPCREVWEELILPWEGQRSPLGGGDSWARIWWVSGICRPMGKEGNWRGGGGGRGQRGKSMLWARLGPSKQGCRHIKDLHPWWEVKWEAGCRVAVQPVLRTPGRCRTFGHLNWEACWQLSERPQWSLLGKWTTRWLN